MLSENLQSLADHYRKYSKTGLTMEAPAVFTICAVLESAVDDAKALEAMTVPMANQLTDDLPSNVVRIEEKPRRLGKTFGKPGGDAA